MGIIKDILKNRSLELATEAHSCGYCWAAGELLSGALIVNVKTEVDGELYTSKHIDFKRGVLDAIAQFEQVAKPEIIATQRVLPDVSI